MNSRNVNRTEENVVKGHRERSERAELSPMPMPALPNHPCIEVLKGTEKPFYIIVSPTHYQFETDYFSTQKWAGLPLSARLADREFLSGR